ncbi:hypothetical protein LPJ72_005971 [Coemansia sp. Benny D160-2]|nr:hypothetical protein LPJ72_005971 [Coemansia sp. Benny D160-2]
MDDDFMYEDGEDFVYEEDDGAEDEEEDLGIENKYYNAKAQQDDFGTAVGEFKQLIEEDNAQTSGGSEWGFKATKQLVKLHIRNQKQPEEVLGYYDQMLGYVSRGIVARNEAEKSINDVLDTLASSADAAAAGGHDLAYRAYTATLGALKQTAAARNDRLALRTSLRLARLLMDQKGGDEGARHAELEALLARLKAECMRGPRGDPVAELGTQLLEINALYLELFEARGGESAHILKETYLECTRVKSAIPHPRIAGFIKECGGKMFMRERNWQEAQNSLFEAFKNYDEAGSPHRIRVLKYLVLSSMLCETEISPLSSPEAKAYESDPAIIAMTDMVRAYESQDADAFERVLVAHRAEIHDDPFIRGFIDDLRRTFRIQAMEAAVLPYTSIYLSSLAERFQTPEADVESILFELILDGRLNAAIDQQRGLLVLENGTADAAHYEALSSWATNVESLMRSSFGALT